MNDSDHLSLLQSQIQLHWSRLQTLGVLNIAVFTGWWATKELIWSALIPILGLYLNRAIHLAMARDRNYTDYAKEKLKIKIPKRENYVSTDGHKVAWRIYASLSIANILLLVCSLILGLLGQSNFLPEKTNIQKIEHRVKVLEDLHK